MKIKIGVWRPNGLPEFFVEAKLIFWIWILIFQGRKYQILSKNCQKWPKAFSKHFSKHYKTYKNLQVGSKIHIFYIILYIWIPKKTCKNKEKLHSNEARIWFQKSLFLCGFFISDVQKTLLFIWFFISDAQISLFLFPKQRSLRLRGVLPCLL